MKGLNDTEQATKEQHESRANLFKFLSKINITARKAGILSTLAANKDGEMNMGNLGGEMGVTSPGITALIDKLEDDDLVERKRDAEDSRVTLVELTESGRYLANVLATKWNS